MKGWTNASVSYFVAEQVDYLDLAHSCIRSFIRSFIRIAEPFNLFPRVASSPYFCYLCVHLLLLPGH